MTVAEDSPERSVALTGITAGGSESQPLRVTATSSNTTLLVNPTIDYTSPNTTGTLRFTPVANRSGNSILTVTVTDGGPDLDLATTGDNNTTQITFLIIINAVNDDPTLDPLYELTISEDSASHSVDLFGITAGANESQQLRVTAESSDPSVVPNPSATYVSPDATGSIQFQSLPNAFGEIEITVTVTDGGLDGDLSTEGDNGSVSQVFTLRVTPINDPPSINPVTNQTISEDAAEQTVNLSGITAGPLESQPIKVTATSSNTALIPNPVVTYTTPESTAVLKYQPIADQSGVVVITISVEDGGGDARLDTTTDNVVFTSTFTVTVNAVNDDPTLDQPGDLTINEDAGLQTVELNNVTAGGGETQPLLITATSNNIAVVPNPSVVFDELFHPELQFTAVADQSGEAIITVVVTDGGLDGDLSTNGDNASVTRTFTVTVNPVNDAPTLDQPDNVVIDEDAAEQTISLAGITAGGGENQPISISATSSNTALIADPTVIYFSPNATGSLTFTPAANLSGSAVITVVVSDGGFDGDLTTTDDNSTLTLTFSITVNPFNDAPTLDQPGDLTINEDAEEQTVSLSGITAGGDETQPLMIVAFSEFPAIIADPVVTYSSDDPTGSLTFIPAANVSGVVEITVVVIDGGLDENMGTTGDNGSATYKFIVTINPVNDIPTLDQPGDLTIDEDAVEQTVSLSGITAGGGENQSLSINATSSDSSIIADPTIVYSSPDAVGTLKFTPAADQFGSVDITVVVMDGGLDGDLATLEDNGTFTLDFSVAVNPVNDDPTLDEVDDLSIDEDSGEQTVILTGISAGGGENQPLAISATSSDTTLIDNPTIIYTSADSMGTLKFSPATNLSGSAIITVVITDGGLDGNLSTGNDNASTTIMFNVAVNAVNDAPTLDHPGDVAVDEDSPEQTVQLTGITAGGGETQPISITATSSDAALIADPVVIYSSADPTASLKFTPTANLSSVVVITVTVTDGGFDGDLSTTDDNSSFTLEFEITVNPVNDAPVIDQPLDVTINEDAAEYTVDLTGIAAGGGENQPLSITATSSNSTLIPNPAVVYTSPDATGSLKFTPAADLSGTALITVEVTDGGLDGLLSTTEDNSSITVTFTVTVNAVNDTPTLDQLGDITLSEDAAEQIVNLTGITAGSGESQPLQVTATSSNAALIANPVVTYSGPDSTGSIRFTPAANLSGTTIISVVVTDGGLDGNLATSGDNGIFTRTFTVTVNAVNDAPTLDQPGKVTVSEDAPEQTVTLTGITAGGGEAQQLQVTATSSDTTLIANPTVIYSSPNSTGSLKFTPTANLSGSAMITVVVTDGGLDGDLSTTEDNASVTLTITVTVNAVNDAPTLNQPGNVTILEDAPEQTVSLTGISAGGDESQPLQITATSSNTLLIANPAVTYSSPNATGSLKYTPTANLSGTAVITVVVTDGGLDGNLATTTDNGSLTRTFTVTVNAVNDAPTLDALPNRSIPEDSALQTVQLTGITAGGGETQPLRVTATSSDSTLIPTPTVTYLSANSTGTLTFTPVTARRGSAVIVVSVEDGGPDGDLDTTGDNLIFTRTFTVEVTPIRAVVISPVGSVLMQRPQITWSAVPNAVSYNVWIDNISAGQRPLVQATTSATTFQPSVNLGIGKIDVFIRAVTADGTQLPWSLLHRISVVQQVVPNTINPIQPTGFPTITWPAITGAVRYEVAVDDVSRVIPNFIRTFVTSTSWTPASELQLGVYRFFVRAIAADDSPAWWSNTLLQFTVSTAPRPIAPVTATFNRLQEFVWSAVSGATSYRLQVRSEATGQTVHDISGLANTRWTPPSAFSNGNHSWIVAGFTAAGNMIGNYSARTFFFVGGRPTITAPISMANSVLPQLQWQNVLGAASYQVQLNRSFGGGSETIIFNVSGITSNSLVPPNPLIRGASYRFWVRAVSTSGEVSIWSLPAAFTVVAAEPHKSAPGVFPEVSLAQLETEIEQPAATAQKSAVKRAEEATSETREAAETVFVATAAVIQNTTVTEAAWDALAGADPATVDEAINDVVDVLLSGGLLLN